MAILKNIEQYRPIQITGSKLVAKSKPSRRKGRPAFTKKRIDRMICRGAQRAYFYDGVVRGLAIAVTPAGKKTFILYRKIHGRPERITIGPYPDFSIDQARGEAEKHNASIAQGGNPAEKRREIRDEDTLAELFKSYSENV